MRQGPLKTWSFWLLAAFGRSYRSLWTCARATSLAKRPKILTPHRYIISVNALKTQGVYSKCI
jgi:hypothetical protein